MDFSEPLALYIDFDSIFPDSEVSSWDAGANVSAKKRENLLLNTKEFYDSEKPGIPIEDFVRIMKKLKSSSYGKNKTISMYDVRKVHNATKRISRLANNSGVDTLLDAIGIRKKDIPNDIAKTIET
jgi:hypothetical protein